MKFKIILSALLLIFIFCLAGKALAMTDQEKQALISQIQQQIAILTQQLNQILSQNNQVALNNQGSANQSGQSNQTWCHDFGLNLGYNNSGSLEVQNLHLALQKAGISYGTDDVNTYSILTAQAVSQFQKKYRISSTGWVGPQTRARLNKLYGCQESADSSESAAYNSGVCKASCVKKDNGWYAVDCDGVTTHSCSSDQSCQSLYNPSGLVGAQCASNDDNSGNDNSGSNSNTCKASCAVKDGFAYIVSCDGVTAQKCGSGQTCQKLYGNNSRLLAAVCSGGINNNSSSNSSVAVNQTPRCGDGICNNGENCNTCSIDCGTCLSSSSSSRSSSSNSSSSSTSSSTGSSSSSGSSNSSSSSSGGKGNPWRWSGAYQAAACDADPNNYFQQLCRDEDQEICTHVWNGVGDDCVGTVSSTLQFSNNSKSEKEDILALQLLDNHYSRDLTGLQIDYTNGYAYLNKDQKTIINTKSAEIYRLRLSDMKLDGRLIFADQGLYYSSGVMDSVNGFAYYGLKDDLGNLKIARVRLVDDPTVDGIDNFLVDKVVTLPIKGIITSSGIDTVNGYVYFYKDTDLKDVSPEILKIKLSDFNRKDDQGKELNIVPLKETDYQTLVLPAQDGSHDSCVSCYSEHGPDCVYRCGYINPTIVGSITIDSAHDAGYIMTYYGNSFIKFRLSDLSNIGVLTYPEGHGAVYSSVIDPVHGFAYNYRIDMSNWSTNQTRTLKIAKVDLNTLKEVDSMNLPENFHGGVLAIDPSAGFLYWSGAANSSAGIIKINLSDFTVKSISTTNDDQHYFNAGIRSGTGYVDFQNHTIYFGSGDGTGPAVLKIVDDGF